MTNALPERAYTACTTMAYSLHLIMILVTSICSKHISLAIIVHASTGNAGLLLKKENLLKIVPT